MFKITNLYCCVIFEIMTNAGCYWDQLYLSLIVWSQLNKNLGYIVIVYLIISIYENITTK